MKLPWDSDAAGPAGARAAQKLETWERGQTDADDGPSLGAALASLNGTMSSGDKAVSGLADPGTKEGEDGKHAKAELESSYLCFPPENPWRRKWQPTPVFLPGESQGQRSLVGCCLWGRTRLKWLSSWSGSSQKSPNHWSWRQPAANRFTRKKTVTPDTMT